jgi:hypothetical protein
MKPLRFVRNYLRLLGSARNRLSSLQNYVNRITCIENGICYRGADKSLARPGRKQATGTEDFEFQISYL